jgi:hypothetical protein
MIVHHLSDHAGKLLERSQQDLLRYLQEKDYWEEQLWAADDDRLAARRARRLLLRILGRPSETEVEAYERYEEARRHLDQADHRRRQLQIRVDQQLTGVRGEQRLENALKWLTDDWVMIRGYLNDRGEVDHVLVGPAGVWAVEVKSSNIRLQVNGDRWLQEKVDRRGRVLGREEASDATGRSWGRQVGEVARSLERLLRERDLEAPVRTAVLLMHDRAQLGSIKRSGVDFVGTDHRVLMSRVAGLARPLAADHIAAVVEAIKKDHAFHRRRRLQHRHRTNRKAS